MPDLETKTCAVCKSDVEGYGFDGDVLDRFKREALDQVRAYVAGHECNACGDVICVRCKKEQVGKYDLVGSCPTCGNPWAAKRTFFRPYMERGNRDMFHKLFKYDKQLREKTYPRWPTVLQLVGGTALVVLALRILHVAEDDIAELLNGISWLLLGGGLIVNGIAQAMSPTSSLRSVLGAVLMLVGSGFLVLLAYSYYHTPQDANPYGDIILAIAFCTVGVRHILAHRRHSHSPVDPS